jgi:hypothetical protein
MTVISFSSLTASPQSPSAGTTQLNCSWIPGMTSSSFSHKHKHLVKSPTRLPIFLSALGLSISWCWLGIMVLLLLLFICLVLRKCLTMQSRLILNSPCYLNWLWTFTPPVSASQVVGIYRHVPSHKAQFKYSVQLTLDQNCFPCLPRKDVIAFFSLMTGNFSWTVLT